MILLHSRARHGAPPRLVYQPRRRGLRARRAFDTVAAAMLLMCALPILLVASLCIVLEDGGPVIFRQRRAGRFERLFVLYKLRTMRLSDCSDRPKPASGHDPRLTRVGRVLRKTSIDELPQLINVIRGEMSLVGPRPEMPLMIQGYERWQHMRHLVLPGLTCIWQTASRSEIPLHLPAATIMDLDYINNASPGLDATLIGRTAISLIRPRGAY